jgi:homoserine dehydrogenase
MQFRIIKEKKMFTSPEKIVDSFHTAQKNVLDVVVKDATINKPLSSLLDAQTAFTKQVITASKDVASASYNALVKIKI